MGCMRINTTKLKWRISYVGGFLSRFDFEKSKAVPTLFYNYAKE